MKEIPLGFVAAKVVARREWAEHLFSLRVHAPATEFASPPFIAGQFSKLAVQNENGEWVRRAYSMVNKPSIESDCAVFEFLVIEIPDGQLTPLLSRLNPGDSILVGLLPAGFMTLNEVPENIKDLWMLSTGTGIGPFISILEEIELCQRFEHLVLVHAVRTKQELVYQDKIQQLVEHYQGKLRYIPIVSRESVDGALSGRIPEQLEIGGLVTAAHLPLTKEETFFYLCGNPNMVHDTRDTLQKMGYKKHLRREAGQFSFENYW